jgi:hypothetical protein
MGFLAEQFNQKFPCKSTLRPENTVSITLEMEVLDINHIKCKWSQDVHKMAHSDTVPFGRNSTESKETTVYDFFSNTVAVGRIISSNSNIFGDFYSSYCRFLRKKFRTLRKFHGICIGISCKNLICTLALNGQLTRAHSRGG